MADLPPLPELRFAEIPATSRDRYIGDRFCYMEAGQLDRPPVLLLHGIGANSLHWRYQLAGLARRFRVIAWNAPGYTLSDNLRAETPSGREKRSASPASTSSPIRSVPASRRVTPIATPDGSDAPSSPAPASPGPRRRRSEPRL